MVVGESFIMLTELFIHLKKVIDWCCDIPQYVLFFAGS
jgi:hypothetical protein